jgi:hypothetical protein
MVKIQLRISSAFSARAKMDWSGVVISKHSFLSSNRSEALTLQCNSRTMVSGFELEEGKQIVATPRVSHWPACT